MSETFHNKREGKRQREREREKKGRQSQKLDTKAAALVNKSDHLGMPMSCPQRPLPLGCRWVRKRGQNVTLRATLNAASQAPPNSNLGPCPENMVTSDTSWDGETPLSQHIQPENQDRVSVCPLCSTEAAGVPPPPPRSVSGANEEAELYGVSLLTVPHRIYAHTILPHYHRVL